jgi:hypothetical protein
MKGNRRLRIGGILFLISFGVVPTAATAGPWQNLIHSCGKWFKPPTSEQGTVLPLPPIVPDRSPLLARVERDRLQSELFAIAQRNHQYPNDFIDLVKRVEYLGQYAALYHAMEKPLDSRRKEILRNYFPRIRSEWAGKKFSFWCFGSGASPAGLTEEMAEDLVHLANVHQDDAYFAAHHFADAQKRRLYREEIVARVSTAHQAKAISIVSSAGEMDFDTLKAALWVDSDEKLEAFRESVTQGAGGDELFAIARARSSEDLRTLLVRIREKGDEERIWEEYAEKIRSNVTASIHVRTSGITFFRGRPMSHFSIGTLRHATETRLSTLTSGDFGVEHSLEGFRAVAESEKTHAYSANSFVYRIFRREARRRGKFGSGFIHYLKDEDVGLPYDRILTLEVMNSDGNVIGVFGIFDSTPFEGFGDPTLPFLRKRPHLGDAFEKKLREKFATGKKPRVIEVRRLALHPQAAQVDLDRVTGWIATLFEHISPEETVVVIAHTDRSGRAVFERKAKMDVLFQPTELRSSVETESPDEYVLAIDAKNWLPR